MRIRDLVAWRPVGIADAGALVVRATPRDPSATVRPGDDLVLGDDSEFDAAQREATLAGGVPVRVDAARGALVAHTSIVALPPLYVYRGATVTAVASELHLLRAVPGVALELDPVGVTQLGQVGHPVGHRTLFKDVQLVPAGSRLELGPGGVSCTRAWSLPEASPLGWAAFIEAQSAAFLSAVKRLDVSRSFLSLTAGLDTRTVFSTLAVDGRLVPGATMTGPHRSLDARIAERLCAAYGVPHEPVEIGDRFVRDLPRLVTMASRLSGGLESLGQAPEVFLYDVMGSRFNARISGNLGNQVGRGGTEGVSVRGADLAIIAPARREAEGPGGHWLLEQLDGGERSSTEFILQHEIPFTLAGNFTLGSHFAVQQSPYASRGLIETLARRPRAGAAPSRSALRMRLRDLRHRFFGEPAERSFQRTLVARQGGFAAHCPINWGWRPEGGVSPTGLVMGGATLVGMYARARGLDDGALRGFFRTTGLPALHDFRESRRWLRTDLREFVRDTVGAAAVRDAGLFDQAALGAVLDQHFSGARDHYATVTFALDVALAHRLFCLPE